MTTETSTKAAKMNTEANGSSGRKPPRTRRRNKRRFTFENIMGGTIIPKWVLITIGGSLLLFLCLNVYMARLLGEESPTSKNNILRNIWETARRGMHHVSNKHSNNNNIRGGGRHNNNIMMMKNCPKFGCPRMPTDYYEVTKVLAKVEEEKSSPAGASSVLLPFAESSSWEMAAMTRQSNRQHPPFNQDSAVIIQPYRSSQENSDDFFIGIFDGHGEDGHVDARYFVKDVPSRLAEKLDKEFPAGRGESATDEDDILKIRQILKDTFVEADDQAPKNITLRGGCTASVTLRMGRKLFFANAGDSYTMLVSVNREQFKIVEQGPGPGVTMIYTTRADKPHLPAEQARILAAGGKVHIPPTNPMLSRVIVYSHEFNDTIGLAMSRSLGDYEWTVKGVIPEPLVDVIDLDQLQDDLINDPATSIFVIAASDGLWDYRLKQWYAKQFAESYLKGDDKRKVHPLLKMKNIIDFVSPKKESFYRDDITAITMQVT